MSLSNRPLAGTRIAFAAFEPFPNAKGSGTRMFQMVTALVEAGAQVRFFTLRGRDAEVALPKGVEHRPLSLQNPNFLRRGQQYREQLLREFHAFRPQVVHYRGLFEAQAANAYAETERVVRVFEVNGLFSIELPYHYPQIGDALDFQRKLRVMEANALTEADLVLTQSETTRAFLIDRAPEIRERCIAIPNGAELPLDAPKAEPRSVPRLLYAGTMAPWQGVAELLMAVRRVAKVQPVQLALAGPMRRRWRKQIERAARRLGLGDSVELLGPLPREILRQEIRDSDVCVAPLRRDTRNLHQGCSPIKLFEYMAEGRPVVSTDLPCVREIIVPEVTGLLATSTRPSALAEPILRLLDDRAFAHGLGRSAGLYIAQTATWQHRRDTLRNTYAARVLPLI